MPRYQAAIDSKWDADRALAYMADFRHASEWDPSVARASLAGSSAVGHGSAFDIEVRMGKRTMKLRYRITALTSRSVTLTARSRLLLSVDTVTVTPRGESCVVEYNAYLTFLRWAKIANPILALQFSRLGDRAKAGLIDNLNR